MKPRAEMLADMTEWLKREHGIVLARRARLRERLCAGDAVAGARRRSGSARWPISRVTRPRFRSPATMNSSAGRNGNRSGRPMVSPSANSGPCSRNSCTRPSCGGEVDVIAGYTSDGRIAQHRSRRAGRSQTRHSALRRGAAGFAEARRRSGAAGRARATGRRDRRRGDARGQSARIGRRRVGERSRALAVERDTEEEYCALTSAANPILPRPQPPRLHPDEEPRGARRLEGRGRRPIRVYPRSATKSRRNPTCGLRDAFFAMLLRMMPGESAF